MNKLQAATLVLLLLACDRSPDATKASGARSYALDVVASPTTTHSDAPAPTTHAHAPTPKSTTIADSTRQESVRRRPLFRIGVLDGDDHQIFGRIRSIQADSNGDIYVLDEQSLNVRWFDKEGRYRGTAGRSGGGPGEFRAPMSLALDERGRIEVLDMALRRISTFAATDSGLVLAKERTIPMHALDFCRINHRYFLLWPAPAGLIHEVGPTDSVIASFGALAVAIPKQLERHASVLRQLGSRGRLYCSENPPLIVHFPESTPVLQAFTPAGQLRWSLTLPDYHARRFELIRNGRGLRVAPDPVSGTTHGGYYLARLAMDTIAITLRETSLANAEGPFELRLLSLTDGHQIAVSNTNDIIAIRHGAREYSFVNHPYPRVTVTSPTKER